MTDEAKRLVDALRDHAEWAHANEWESPITLGDVLEAAADMIEKLSADLEDDDRKYSRIAFETIVAEGLKTEADRDGWKRRADAAERDLHGACWSCVHSKSYEVLPGCTAHQCDYHDSITDRVFKSNCEDWKWRGPCAENGGAEDGNQANPV